MFSIFKNYKQELDILEQRIKELGSEKNELNILEAGCGREWVINLHGINYKLTGIDTDVNALELRKRGKGDLDEIIIGDLTTADLEPRNFDVIYNSFVLEHIDGAEKVMNKFITWLKPGGLLIIRIPDRDSAYGFVTRLTPFWAHVAYKKYFLGAPNAGKPGYDPYPTYYDSIVSRKGIRSFCEENNISIEEEWGHPFPMEWDRFGSVLAFVSRTLNILSFGKLAYKHNNLTYILKKK